MNCEITKNNDDWNMTVFADETPTDYVKVVRCNDCKYCTEQGDWCQNENVRSMCFTDGLVEHYFGYGRAHFYPDMDFFCKYGERKDTDECNRDCV